MLPGCSTRCRALTFDVDIVSSIVERATRPLGQSTVDDMGTALRYLVSKADFAKRRADL
jgi:hypothetical protein